jgi:predicted transcriptional regulator
LAPVEATVTEDLSSLLFNLASADRLSLLVEIGLRKQRLTDLSKGINASAQECSRHLTRLVDAGLVSKDSSGLYEMTPLGTATQSLLPGFRFLLTHKEEFLSHDLSFLPPGFLERIGELSAGEHVSHFSQVLDHVKSTISGAREFVWLISDQPIVVGDIGTSFRSPDIPVRLISEPTVDPKFLSAVRAALPHSQIGALPDVRIGMAINEKAAGVCFPGLDAEIDFGMGFAGDDSRFRGWCADLFEHYWSRSRKVTNL